MNIEKKISQEGSHKVHSFVLKCALPSATNFQSELKNPGFLSCGEVAMFLNLGGVCVLEN